MASKAAPRLFVLMLTRNRVLLMIFFTERITVIAAYPIDSGKAMM